MAPFCKLGGALSEKYLRSFIESLKFNSDFTCVKGKQNHWVPIDKATAETLLNTEKRLELLDNGVTLTQLAQIKRMIAWRSGNLRKEKTEAVQKKLKEVGDPFEVADLFRDVDLSPHQNKNLVFVSKETKKVMDINAEQVLVPLRILDSELVNKKIASAPLVRFVYDINEPPGFTGQLGGHGIFKYFNTFKRPDFSKIKEVPLKPVYREYFERLIPIEYQRRWFFSWAIRASEAVCDTLVLLVGNMGTGKSTLMAIASTFHRPEDVLVEQSKKIAPRFNSNRERKRLVVYDEVVCREEDKSDMKASFSTRTTIEAKGVDARDGKLFISTIAATNNPEDFHLEKRDRRISVLDLCQNQLTAEIGSITHPLSVRIWKDALTQEDKEDIKAIHKYMQENQLPDFRSDIPIKGEMFKEICDRHLPAMLYFVLSELRKVPGVAVSYVALREAWDRKNSTGSKRNNFYKFPTLATKIQQNIDEDLELLAVNNTDRTLTLTFKELL